MTHRRRGMAAVAAAVLALVAAACSDDDDTGGATTPATEPTSGSTVPTTTEPPPTTEPASTTSTTEPATTTTIDLEALKAEIAEDYVRAEQAREDLVRNPTLEDLEERVAQIAAPGSKSYDDLVELVRGMVNRGERVVPGAPDYSDVLVESVDLVGDPSEGTAAVTACYVINSARIGASSVPLEGTGRLYAVRTLQPVRRTPGGWLPADQPTGLASTEGATSCRPA